MADASSVPAPSEDEKTMALLAHILQIFTWWIGPLIIYLVKRESRFVRFHAMQALIWQIALSVLMMFGVVLWIFLILGAVILPVGEAASHRAPPVALLVILPLLWLGAMSLSIVNIVLGILYAVKASRGEWAAYPVIGGWASRIAAR